MSEQPPSHPLFDAQAREKEPAERERDLEALQERLSRYRDSRNEREPIPEFEPALLVRAIAGDRGARPLSVPFWESPDIWTAVGAPADTPVVPATPGGQAVAGVPNTLYAHVWNLGLAPVVGATVEFFVFDPSLTFATQTPLFQATTYVDLAGRTSPGQCHRLVKCPVPWIPIVVNDGHECLLVRVTAMGDAPDPAHRWDAWADRRIGQRNIGVVTSGASIAPILEGLQQSRLGRTRIELVQVGIEARHVLALTTPELTPDPRVRTQVLAELGARGDITLPRTRLQEAPVPAGRGPLRDTFAAGRVPRLALDAILDLPVDTHAVAAVPRVRRTGRIPLVQRRGTVTDLLAHSRLLSDELKRQTSELSPPEQGTAQVLRIAEYEGDQMVGGYTVVVAPR
jgi:hypothetical protein